MERRRPFPRPSRRRVITVANQKGGVGKTTTTVNLAAALAMHGVRVLVVDLDPQGNASTALGVDHRSGTPSIYEVLLGDRPLDEVVVRSSESSGLFCAPATIDLAGAEIELVSMVARETRLRRAIDGMRNEVDYVLIDCPPSLGLLTVNALVAARELLIPIQCEYYALEGLGQLLRNVELVQAHLNQELRLSTILLTMYDSRTRLADQVVHEVKEHFGDRVLSTTIPRNVRLAEAPSYGQSVLTYDPASRGSLSYLAAARELAERGVDPAPRGTAGSARDGAPSGPIPTGGAPVNGHSPAGHAPPTGRGTGAAQAGPDRHGPPSGYGPDGRADGRVDGRSDGRADSRADGRGADDYAAADGYGTDGYNATDGYGAANGYDADDSYPAADDRYGTPADGYDSPGGHAAPAGPSTPDGFAVPDGPMIPGAPSTRDGYGRPNGYGPHGGAAGPGGPNLNGAGR
nr:AAA family ATPase [Frankia sp. Mgl5]